MIRGKLRKFAFWLLGVETPRYVCKEISRDIALATSVGEKDVVNGVEAVVVDVIKLFDRSHAYLAVLDTKLSGGEIND